MAINQWMRGFAEVHMRAGVLMVEWEVRVLVRDIMPLYLITIGINEAARKKE